ncbi:hypothetical protein Tco_0140267 [Tanacetum coccineum]
MIVASMEKRSMGFPARHASLLSRLSLLRSGYTKQEVYGWLCAGIEPSTIATDFEGKMELLSSRKRAGESCTSNVEVSVVGTPPQDVIEDVAETIATAMVTYKTETTSPTLAKEKPASTKRSLLPQLSSEAKKKKRD